MLKCNENNNKKIMLIKIHFLANMHIFIIYKYIWNLYINKKKKKKNAKYNLPFSFD